MPPFKFPHLTLDSCQPLNIRLFFSGCYRINSPLSLNALSAALPESFLQLLLQLSALALADAEKLRAANRAYALGRRPLVL